MKWKIENKNGHFKGEVSGKGHDEMSIKKEDKDNGLFGLGPEAW